MGPRLLFVGHAASRTGAPIVLLHLVSWLHENTNSDISILLKEGGPLVPDYRNAGRTKIYMPESRLDKFDWKSKVRLPFAKNILKQLSSNFDDYGYDMVYFNTIDNGIIMSEFGTVDFPIVTHVHELDSWIRQVGSNNLNMVRQMSSHFIVPSNAVKTALIKRYGFPVSKTDVVYEFIQTKIAGPKPKGLEVRNSLTIEPDAFVIGSSGLAYWRKGKDLFIQLALEVNKRLPDRSIHFLWTGQMKQKEGYRLQHDIDHAGLEGKVHFVGQVSNPLQYYSAMDIFVLMSREDPFPLVCLEAASLSKPILCFDNAGGMPEFVEKDAGFVVPYLDIVAMAEYCVKLALDRSLIERLGTRAAEKVVERCDVEVAGRKIVKILNRLLPEEKMIKTKSI
jgi:glycosyltransferase involved in cell wall biosynthesis